VPVLQCLQLKELEAKGGDSSAQRWRVVLSDVRNYVQCMLATQANHVIHDGKLKRCSIIRMKQYQSQMVKGKNILIILDLDVIESLGTPEKIGEPKPLEAASGEAQNTVIGGAGFYGAKKEPQATHESKSQVKRDLPTRNAGANGGGQNSHIYPIESLSPYAHKWTIKARVTNKSDIKTWHKASGEGKLFSVNLLDESGEIKATAFNDQCDQFYSVLQEGSVYYISSPCRVNIAKKQFTNLPNDYELTFERDTQIEKCEDQGAVPQVRFNFCSIQDLSQVEKDATVDVIGVLKEAGEVSTITSKKTQKDFEKRELTLVDDTGYSIRCTIWGKQAVGFDAPPESVVAMKGTKVSDFGGRSLSLLASGSMSVDPDIPEAHRLKGWYDASGRNDQFASHNSMMGSVGAATGRKDQNKHIAQVKDENLGMNEQPDYFTVAATIVFIKRETFAYPACRSEGCNKKVTDLGDGTGWMCEKCNITHDRPEYRYIMSINVNDHTGQMWLSCFDETARAIMGKTADELMEYKEQDDEGGAARVDAAFDAANFRKWSFRCRAKMDNYGDQQR
jgi:replication factor A1